MIMKSCRKPAFFMLKANRQPILENYYICLLLQRNLPRINKPLQKKPDVIVSDKEVDEMLLFYKLKKQNDK